MESYNHLIREFHDSQATPSHLLQLKSLADQLFRQRTSKKVHCLMKKNELQSIRQSQESCLSQSRLSVTMRSSSASSFSSARQDTGQADREDLKRKTAELQKQIAVLNDKNQALSNQLNILIRKEQDIENVNKRSELQVFNALQALYIEAARQNEGQLKEQHLLRNLKHRRQILARQVEQLVKLKENNEQLVKKWSRVKETKIISATTSADDTQRLQVMLTTLLKLHQMIRNKQSQQNGPQNYDVAMQMVSNLKNTLQLTALLENINVRIGDELAKQAIGYYQQLESQFDRNERANKQINFYLQSLHNKHLELSQTIEKAQLQKEKRAKEHLKKTEFSLKELEEHFNSSCRVVTTFTNNLHKILQRMASLKATLCGILAKGKSALFKTSQLDGLDESILTCYDEQLNKNPEDFKVRWFQSLTSNIAFYHKYIENNDLLRIMSCPESYNPNLSDLINYEMFIVSCFRSVQDYAKRMYKQARAFFKYCQYDAKVNSTKNLLRAQDNQFCVESMDYYRRDNYKLLEKLKKNELRKKGLLVQIPFNVNLQNQLLPSGEEKDDKLLTTLQTPRTTERNRKYMKYTDLATRREERSIRNSIVRKLCSQLNSYRSQSSSRFRNLNSLRESKLTLNASNDCQRNSMKRITMARKTVGTLHKQNSSKY